MCQQLTDMNFDCLTIIFDQLPSSDLTSMAELNKASFSIVDAVYRRRFSKNLLVFKSPYYTGSNPLKNRDEISDLPTMFKTLEKFGPLITNLEIMNHRYWSAQEAKKLHKLVSLHCSETLTKIRILGDDVDIFADISMPFKVAKDVSLVGWFKRTDNSKFTFSGLFPSVRRLKLQMNIHMMNISGEKMAYLEHLITECGEPHKIPSVQKLLTNNPHIKNLTLDRVRPDMLQFASKELLQLETLEVNCYLETLEGNQHLEFDFWELKNLVVRNNACEVDFKIQSVIELLESSQHLMSLELYYRWGHDTRLTFDALKQRFSDDDCIITEFDEHFAVDCSSK